MIVGTAERIAEKGVMIIETCTDQQGRVLPSGVPYVGVVPSKPSEVRAVWQIGGVVVHWKTR